jgi:hypothetical protein
MQRDLGRETRDRLATLEQATQLHSEVLGAFVEHVPALAAILNSTAVSNADDAQRLEEALVRRAFQLCESLLRQALLPQEAAYNTQVVQRNAKRLVQLVEILSATTANRGPHG